MKKVTYCFLLAGGVFLASCEDALEESPKDATVENFYQTPAEAEAGLAAVYAPLRGQMSGWWLGILETHAEWGAGMSGAANFDSYKSMQGLDNVGTSNLIPRWDAFYSSIRNANLVIRYMPQSEALGQEQIDRYLAEARFLRAFTYFQLVRGWGGVPVYTEENMDETTGAPRSSREEVYELITGDLEFAEDNLPDDPPVPGRPSRWVVKTLLADVYFYQDMYDEASAKAEEVITSGKYRLEEISEPDDFNNLFGLSASSPEEIFYLKYNENSNSQVVLFTQQITTPWFGSNGYGVITWHDEAVFYQNWDDQDFRKQFNWYEEEVRQNPFLPGQSAFPNSGVTFLSPKKYNAPDATISTFDFPVYRYADVLLLYAEASARAGGSPDADAMEKLNMVHRRAYGYPSTQASPVDFSLGDYSGADAFADLVIRERGYEFQFEAKRWFDLVRSGKVQEVMKSAIDRDVADKHLLWPIPPIEFDLNEALNPEDQNPGYH